MNEKNVNEIKKQITMKIKKMNIGESLQSELTLNTLLTMEKTIVVISKYKEKMKISHLSINSLLLLGAEFEILTNQIIQLMQEHHL